MYLDGVICVVDGVFAFNVSLFHDTIRAWHSQAVHQEL